MTQQEIIDLICNTCQNDKIIDNLEYSIHTRHQLIKIMKDLLEEALPWNHFQYWTICRASSVQNPSSTGVSLLEFGYPDYILVPMQLMIRLNEISLDFLQSRLINKTTYHNPYIFAWYELDELEKENEETFQNIFNQEISWL